MSFDELGLSPETLRAVADAGYSEPTPIQKKAIPYVLMGRDIVGVAQTGTGKTASFTLPLIDILAGGQAKARMPRALILEPTRELADQVQASFVRYGKYHRLTTALLIGGVSFGEQEKLLDRGVDVLIATPGRLLDHFERGRVMLTGVKILVIDEADRMMDMGFMPDVERIVKLTPPMRQSLFFSATMPPEMRRLASAFLSNPKEISVAPPASPAETVKQSCIMVGRRDKRAALCRLLRQEDVKNAIIFCNRKRDVDLLAKALKKEGFNAGPIHGDLPQSVRMETLEAFKTGKLTLLVASDVAARGLDVQGLSHVFNYDVPMSADDYVHRIGRTGRAGQTGRAYMLATPDDEKFLAAIHALIKREIPQESLEGIEVPAAAAEADEAEREERKGRGRSRRRGRAAESRGADETAAEAAPAEAGPPAEPVAEAAPAAEAEAAPASKARRRRAGARRSREQEAASGADLAAEAVAAAPVAGADAAGPDEARVQDARVRDERTVDAAAEARDVAAPAARPAREPRSREQHARENGAAAQPQHRLPEPARSRGPEPRRRGRNGGERNGGSGENRHHDAGKPVIGMGDHVPAFLMRPVRRQQG